jgi:hypothetical protein
MIPLRRVGGDQFAVAGRQRRILAQDGLREARQVRGCIGLKCEKVSDLRVLGAASPHGINRARPRRRLRVGLYIGKKHRVHGARMYRAGRKCAHSGKPLAQGRGRSGSKRNLRRSGSLHYRARVFKVLAHCAAGALLIAVVDGVIDFAVEHDGVRHIDVA